jgi:Tfp pilus assembly protein PilF
MCVHVINAIMNRGVAYLNKGEYKEAEQDFRRAISLNPHVQKAYHGLHRAIHGQQAE